MDRAGHHAVSLTLVNHHGSKIAYVRHDIPRVVLSDALVLPEFVVGPRVVFEKPPMSPARRCSRRSIEDPAVEILSRMTCSLPRRVMSATSRRSRISAARRILSSSPSGSTMCCFFALAFCMSSNSNILGVTMLARVVTTFSASSSTFTFFSNTASALVILRSLSGEMTAWILSSNRGRGKSVLAHAQNGHHLRKTPR